MASSELTDVDNGLIELFAGYNGLGIAVEAALDAEMVAYSEWDDGPAAILAHHYPTVPNLGDITLIDWDKLAADYARRRIHIKAISGGSPCQDLSLAGRRRGMTEGTRSNLWANMREGIAIIRPDYVVWENVRGALSAHAVSDADGDHTPHQRAELNRLEAAILDHERRAEQATTDEETEHHIGQAAKYLEQHEGLLGGAGSRHLRALGRVLGDLADLGYDCQWRGLRAADVGACHGRFRVFLLARRRDAPAAPDSRSLGSGESDLPADVRSAIHDRPAFPNKSDPGHLRSEPGNPAAQDPDVAAGSQRRITAPGQAAGGRTRPDAGGRSGALVADAGSATVGEHSGEPSAEEARTANCHGSCDTCGERHDRHWRETISRERAIDWGVYEPAIQRWERVTGRPAPRPTEPTGRDGAHRLSARLTEWMMGVTDGWITSTPGITRNTAIKAAGNGVVPQQAYAALRHMLMTYRTHPAYQAS